MLVRRLVTLAVLCLVLWPGVSLADDEKKLTPCAEGQAPLEMDNPNNPLCDEHPSPPLQWSCGLSGRDRYLVATGQIFHSDAVEQGFCGLSYDGWYVEAWGSTSQTHHFGDEWDLTVQKSLKLGGSKFGVDVGALYINVNDNELSQIVQPFVYLNRSWGNGVAAQWRLKYPMPTSGELPEKGLIFESEVNRNWQVGNYWRLGGALVATYDIQGAFGYNPAVIVQAKPKVSLILGDGISLDLFYIWSNPMGDPGDGRQREGMTGIGVSYNF